MSDLTPIEIDRTRRLLALAVLAVFELAALGALAVACGKKPSPETGSTPSPQGTATRTKPAIPAEESPSIKESAAAGQAPYSAVREPFDGAIDDRGRLWVLDSVNGRLRIFDRQGGWLGGWGGTREKGTYSLRGPEGIAIEGDTVYVADTWSGGARAFSLAGEPKGSALGLYGPRGIAAAEGAVWVTDTGNARLVIYDAQLKNPRIVGKPGSGAAEFSGPVGIAIGPSGTVFVGDSGNGRIQVLNREGGYVRAWSIPWMKTSWRAHVAADQNGNVYVSNPDGSEVLSFSKTGTPQKRWGADDSGIKFLRPVGVVVDRKQGILYVMDTGIHKVLKVNLSGTGAR